MKDISEMTHEEIEAMVSEEIKDGERQYEIIKRFISELFPNYEWDGHEWNIPKGWIKIKIKPRKK